MSIYVEIPDPLAGKVEDAARSRSTSPERYVVDVVAQTLDDNTSPANQHSREETTNPLVGLLANDPEFADFLCENAYTMRATLPMRTPGE